MDMHYVVRAQCAAAPGTCRCAEGMLLQCRMPRGLKHAATLPCPQLTSWHSTTCSVSSSPAQPAAGQPSQQLIHQPSLPWKVTTPCGSHRAFSIIPATPSFIHQREVCTAQINAIPAQYLEGNNAARVSPRLLLQPRHTLLLPNILHQLGRHERVRAAQQRKRLPAAAAVGGPGGAAEHEGC